MTKRAGHELDSDRWRSLLAKRLVACPPHQLVPRHPERNQFCIGPTGALCFELKAHLFEQISLLDVHGDLPDAEHKRKQPCEAKDGSDEAVPENFHGGHCVFRFGSFGEMAHWQGNR